MTQFDVDKCMSGFYRLDEKSISTKMSIGDILRFNYSKQSCVLVHKR